MENISDSMRAFLIGIEQTEKRRKLEALAAQYAAERKAKEAAEAEQKKAESDLLFSILETNLEETEKKFVIAENPHEKIMLGGKALDTLRLMTNEAQNWEIEIKP